MRNEMPWLCETTPAAHPGTWLCQWWAVDGIGVELLNVAGMSEKAARILASVAPLFGHDGRMMSETYQTEVYPVDGPPRIGSWEQTTVVVVPAE